MTPNTPKPELEPKPVELVTRLKARTVKLYKGLFSEDIPDPDCLEAAATIASLTAERDDYREKWEAAGRAAKRRQDDIEKYQTYASDKSNQFIEATRLRYAAERELTKALDANKLLSERVAVLEDAEKRVKELERDK